MLLIGSTLFDPAPQRLFFRVRQRLLRFRRRHHDVFVGTGDAIPEFTCGHIAWLHRDQTIVIGGPDAGNFIKAKYDYDAENVSKVNIRLYSLTGTLVKEEWANTSVGKNSLPLNLSNLPAGGYIVYLNDHGKKASSTLIKK